MAESIANTRNPKYPEMAKAIQAKPEWLRQYWRMGRRERYLVERDVKHGLTYYAEAVEAVTDGRDEAAMVINRLMVERALSVLTAVERRCVVAVYVDREPVTEVARREGVAYRTMGYRLERALYKARRELMHRHYG